MYGGILAARSSVFKDMLSFPQPQPPTKIDILKGSTPSISLQDSVGDVHVFLSSIFDSSFFEPRLATVDLSVVLAISRMADKYDVPYLLQRALAHLADFYPRSLEDWDNRKRVGRLESLSDLDDDMSVLQTALRINATEILPIAFYASARHDLDRIINHRRWSHIREDYRFRFLVGYVNQSLACRAMHTFLHLSAVDGCTSPPACQRGLQFYTKHSHIWPKQDPLEAWSGWGCLYLDVCTACFTACKEKHKAGRQKFWDGIPVIFGFPGAGEGEELH